MKRLFFALVLCAYSLSAQSALMVFDSESDFLATAPIVSTETFDGFATGGLTTEAEIVIDDVSYRLASTFECAVIAMGPCWGITTFGAVSLPNTLRSGEVPWTDHVLSFGSNRFVEAFGFYYIGARDSTITINETDGNSSVIDLNQIAGSSPALYFGFQSDAGIRDIVVAGNLFAGSGFSFDNVSRSQIVPIPAAVWLFGSGLGLLSWMRRKKA